MTMGMAGAALREYNAKKINQMCVTALGKVILKREDEWEETILAHMAFRRAFAEKRRRWTLGLWPIPSEEVLRERTINSLKAPGTLAPFGSEFRRVNDKYSRAIKIIEEVRDTARNQLSASDSQTIWLNSATYQSLEWWFRHDC